MADYSDHVFQFIGSEEEALNNSTPYGRLKGKSGKERDQEIKRMISEGVLSPQDDGLLGEAADRFMQGSVGMIRSIGSTLEEAGLGSGIRRWGDATLAANQQWRRPLHVGFMGSVGGFLGEIWFISLPLFLILLWILCKRGKRLLKKHMIKLTQKRKYSEKCQVAALQELENKNVDQATWAKSMINAQGNEEKAKAEYLRIRKI